MPQSCLTTLPGAGISDASAGASPEPYLDPGSGPKDAFSRPDSRRRSNGGPTKTKRRTPKGRRANDRPSAETAAEIHARSIVDLSPNGVVSIDHEGCVLEFNPAAERMFGYARADVLGRQMAELIVPPELREAHYAGLSRYLATNEGRLLGRRLELEGMRADGSRIPIELAIVRVPVPGPPVFTSYVRDLTEPRRAAERQKILVDASAMLAESVDYEQTLRNLSRAVIPAFADWYAVDVRDAESGEVRRIHVDHRDPARVAMARVMARRYPSTDESRGVHAVLRTGVTEWLREIPEDLIEHAAQSPEHLQMLRRLGLRSYIVVPLSSHGRLYGALTLVTAESGRLYDQDDVALAEELGRRVGQAVENARLFREIDQQRQLLQDQQTELEAQAAELEETSEALSKANATLEEKIAELKELTKEALHARDEADEANRAKSEFLRSMSHELRTPLNAILGYVDLIGMGIHGTVNEKQTESLQRVKRSGHHLLGLINDVLNFARIEAGRVDYRIHSVPVSEVLVAAGEIIAPQVATKAIRYAERDECPGAAVCADREKLVQILINLLGNAVHHTAAGGEIELACTLDSGMVSFSVRDTGPGIPTDKHETIFEPFVQIVGMHEGERQGTGLGLSISRQLARAMDGDISVQSRLGEGSTFTLRLPADGRSIPAAQPGAARSAKRS